VILRSTAWVLAYLWATVATAQTLASTAADDPVPSSSSSPAVQRPDELTARQPLTVEWLGRPLTFRLGYEGSVERRGNFDLDATRQRDRDIQEHELKLGARWALSDRMSVLVQAVGFAERRLSRRDRSVQTSQSWERGQTWLLAEPWAGVPLTLQIGRVALLERRSWWWDEDLDAVRAIYAPQGWRLESGLARELGRVSTAQSGIDPAARGVTRWFGQVTREWAPRHRVDLFWLSAWDRSGSPAVGTAFVEDQEDALDGRQRWLGLRASGEQRWAFGHRWTYRADWVQLRGRQSRTPFTSDPQERLIAGVTQEVALRSYAWDVGAQWILPGEARPTFSIGWAQGSGGGLSGGVDRSFQQTGLHENKSRVGGVKRLRYYGELLDPELSNLDVASAGLGFRFRGKNSAELIWHRYRQLQPSVAVTGSRLSQAPSGISRRLGHELDLFMAFREIEGFEWTLTLSRFVPGPAFSNDRRDAAHGVELGAALSF
jgi:alginate production protein